MDIRFYIHGDPFGKQRPRHRKNGCTYTPSETVAYEKKVQAAFLEEACKGDYTGPVTGPVRIGVKAYYKIAESASVKKKRELEGTPCMKRPDNDNVLKIIQDGLEGSAYKNDCQVVRSGVVKVWSVSPGVLVHITDE